MITVIPKIFDDISWMHPTTGKAAVTEHLGTITSLAGGPQIKSNQRATR